MVSGILLVLGPFNRNLECLCFVYTIEYHTIPYYTKLYHTIIIHHTILGMLIHVYVVFGAHRSFQLENLIIQEPD